jgi:hypothetical protein
MPLNSVFFYITATIISYNVRFRVLTVASMKMIAFWDVVPSSLEVGRRFRGVCCLHHQAISCFLLPDDMENHGGIISTKGKS